MKLFDSKLGPNPRRVRIFLAEKGIDVPKVQVDLAKGEQKNEDFTRINPLQRTPALVLDDGAVLTESMAICRYFEELQPDPPLFGEEPLGKAQVEMWQRRAELNFFFMVANAYRHSHPGAAALEQPQIAQVAEVSRGRALEFLAILDRVLSEREFLAGDRFTVADITALVAADFMRPARIAMPEEAKNVLRWHRSVSGRPSAQA